MLNHSSNNHNENHIDHKIIRDQISEWKKYIKAEEAILEVTTVLLKHKIICFDDIEQLKHEKGRNFLNENKFITSSILCNMFNKFGDNPEGYIVILNRTHKKYLKYIRDKGDSYYDDAKEPSEKELQLFKEQRLLCRLAANNDANDDNIISIIKLEKLIDKELLHSLFRLLEWQEQNFNYYFAEQENKDNYRNNVIKQYEVNISTLRNNIYKTCELIKLLNQQLGIPKLTLIQSPNHLYNGTKGLKQNKKLIDFAVQSSDFVVMKLLFKNIAPEIYLELEKEIAVEDQKNAIQSYVVQNSEEIIAYISGEKLKKTEDIIFSAFRALAIKAFQLQEVDSPDRKVIVKTSDFFRLCNLKNRKEGGYDTNQKTKIKELLKQESNLLKPIFYENGKSFVVTSFIKYLYWNNDNTITFEIDSMFFVNKEDGLSFFCEDIEGRNRLTSEMPNSEAAYKLHKYFSYALKSPIQEFNVTLLLQKSGLIESYNSKHQNRALNKLQQILDTMFKLNTIIKDKPIRIASASDNLGKYKIVNSRYKEIKAIEQKCKKKLKTSKLKLLV
jgi:hypothetical protein